MPICICRSTLCGEFVRPVRIKWTKCWNAVKNCVLSILWYGDAAYPEQLLSIVNPPVLLFYQGDSSLLQNHLLLTVVGTRNPAEYSLRVEKTICHDLVQMGFVPVTGYAAGIDITANLCALEADKPSIAPDGLRAGRGVSEIPCKLEI